MSQTNRFYIFTGKGGVGKTTLSFAFCQYLQQQGKKVAYLYLKTGAIAESKKELDQGQKLAEKLGIRSLGLDLKECAQEYVSRKMKSATIGKWTVRTPFFKALINMIPGFSYLIYLGRALEYLKEDPELIIVMDSPSSGHALTMLEATHNFREVFQSGLVFDDAQKMIDMMFKPEFMQVNILTLPTSMAVHEGLELERDLKKIANIQTKVFCNNSYHNIEGVKDSEIPGFLQEKIDNEHQLLKEHEENISSFVDHSPSLSPEEIIKDIVPSMKNLV
jgi:anion-transporting  ArsA/GET3 family ATPase